MPNNELIEEVTEEVVEAIPSKFSLRKAGKITAVVTVVGLALAEAVTLVKKAADKIAAYKEAKKAENAETPEVIDVEVQEAKKAQ